MQSWKTTTKDEQKVWELLNEIDQKHLFENIDHVSIEEREKFIKQVSNLTSL